ncbi:MAG: ATP-binding protein, partial [Alphaproteobacteria bacterium]
RQRLIDGLIAWLMVAARDKPLLFVVEDIHWADDSTLGFLRALMERAAASRIMTVLTTRQAGGAPAGLAAVSHVALHALSLDEARNLALRTAGKPLPEEVIAQILARTDGVPLFVEEVTRTAVASPLLIEREDRFVVGAAGVPTIPMTLRDSLMSRLDALGRSKQVAQIASVLGRSFPELLVRLVADIQQARLEEHLRTLLDARFFCREEEPAEPTYAFTHALLQDAAYDSLLRQTRQLYHRRTAEALERSFPDATRLQPEILARHYALGGEAARAVALWEAAGRRSAARSANVEAATQLGNALALIGELPDGADRRRLELRLRVALGGQLIITAGNADPGVERAFERARELSEELSEPGMLFQARRGLLSFYQVRGRPRVARRFGVEMLAQARAAGDADLMIQAHRALGLCLFFLGEFAGARTHLAEALDRCRAAEGRSDGVAFISDPTVLAQCNLGWVEAALGRPDTGLAHCEEAVARARSVRHQHSLAYALGIRAAVHQARREPEQVLRNAEEILSLARHGGYTYWAGWARGLRGWARGVGGDATGGLNELDTALVDYAATGAEVMRPFYLSLKAELLLHADRPTEAGQALAAAAADIDAHGMAFCHGDVLRLQARAASVAGDHAAAAALLDRADRVAEVQGAALLRLRAAFDRTRGLEGDVRDLARLHGAMSEGHGLADMAAARALIEAEGLDAAVRRATPPAPVPGPDQPEGPALPA